MSTNTILASAPLTSTGYHLKANGTTLGNSLIWDNGTNVGIGNTNTSYTLDVSGTAKVSGITSLTSATASTSTSTGALVVTGGFGIGGALFGTSAVFNHNDAPTIKIQRSGGTDTNTALEFTNASRSFFIGSNGTTMGLGGTSGSIASQPLQITSAGNVGIGTSSPSSPLSISTNVSSSALSLEVSNSGTYGLIGVRRGTQTGASAGINYYTTTAQKWFTGIYEGSDNFGFYSVAYAGFPMVITTGGNVGIGTSSPSCRLEIAGGYVSLNDNSH